MLGCFLFLFFDFYPFLGTFKVTRTLSEKDVEFRKEGYQNRTIELDAKFNPVSIINLTNVLGWGIDALSGSIKKYDTKVYDIELEPKK